MAQTSTAKPDVFEGRPRCARAHEEDVDVLHRFRNRDAVRGFYQRLHCLQHGPILGARDPTTPFWISNGLLVLSSVALWLAVRWMRAGDKVKTLAALGGTLLFGIGFTVSQAEGWQGMADLGMGWSVSEHDSA